MEETTVTIRPDRKAMREDISWSGAEPACPGERGKAMRALKDAIRLLVTVLGCLIMSQAVASSYTSRQTSKMSPLCPVGSPEAEALHQRARQYRMGTKGKPSNNAKAEALFEEALALGNAKSALQLGQMYLSDYISRYPEKVRRQYMIAMYIQALKMGCPDAYVALAECYENGWGVREDMEKTIEMLRLGAEAGSPKAMEFYGVHLMGKQDAIEPGRQWLKRSLDAGNGEAAMELASSYLREKNTEKWISSLRAGAKQGSKACLSSLYMIYLQGEYGQKMNKKHAGCYKKLDEGIDHIDLPKPIPDLDKICPMQPVLPFKW